MPAKKKPAETRQRRNVDPELEVLPGGGQLAPVSYRGWLKVTKTAWAGFWSSDLANYVKADSDAGALRRLFDMYDERERMVREYRKGRMAKGSTGQLVVNPAAKEIASLDGRIGQLEDRFGLSPMARLKLGVKFGEALASLDQINARMGADDGDEDPRLEVIDIKEA